MQRHVAGAVLAMSLALPTSAPAADRAKVAVSCQATSEKLAYDCLLDLKNARTGVALEGADITLAADMPSMPMAHTVRPVAATAAGSAGQYKARVQLEMLGDWALRLTIKSPLRDQVVEVLSFGEDGAAPAGARAVAPRGNHKH